MLSIKRILVICILLIDIIKFSYTLHSFSNIIGVDQIKVENYNNSDILFKTQVNYYGDNRIEIQSLILVKCFISIILVFITESDLIIFISTLSIALLSCPLSEPYTILLDLLLWIYAFKMTDTTFDKRIIEGILNNYTNNFADRQIIGVVTGKEINWNFINEVDMDVLGEPKTFRIAGSTDMTFKTNEDYRAVAIYPNNNHYDIHVNNNKEVIESKLKV